MPPARRSQQHIGGEARARGDRRGRVISDGGEEALVATQLRAEVGMIELPNGVLWRNGELPLHVVHHLPGLAQLVPGTAVSGQPGVRSERPKVEVAERPREILARYIEPNDVGRLFDA